MIRAFAPVSLLGTLARMGAAASVSVPMPGEGFQDENYHLSIRPDQATGMVSGTETLTVRSTSADFVRAVFTPNALRIRDATADGGSIGAQHRAAEGREGS